MIKNKTYKCDNSKIHINSNFILSISLLIMFDTLLLRPSLHCNTPLYFTNLQPTTLHYTYRHFTSSHLHFTTLPFSFTHSHFLPFSFTSHHYTLHTTHYTLHTAHTYTKHNTVCKFQFLKLVTRDLKSRKEQTIYSFLKQIGTGKAKIVHGRFNAFSYTSSHIHGLVCRYLHPHIVWAG
jgi:hypothetical protein